MLIAKHPVDDSLVRGFEDDLCCKVPNRRPRWVWQDL
jgi:hypothetical protein